MIHEIAFEKPAKSERPKVGGRYASWAWDLPEIAALDACRTVRFRPGLNILFGRNGSGKTTIVRSAALSLAATASGRSVMGEMWLREAVESGVVRRGKTASRIACRVVHDGKPVVYGAAGVMAGMTGSGFDEQFFAQGLGNSLSARGRSSGERTLQSCADALSILRGQAPFPEAIPRTMNRRGVNDVWQAIIDFAEGNFLKANGPEGQPTVLLDEPDAHWSFVAQANLWKVLGAPEVAGRFQVIVATHSPFALAIPHANVIGMPQAAVEETRRAMAGLAAGFA